MRFGLVLQVITENSKIENYSDLIPWIHWDLSWVEINPYELFRLSINENQIIIDQEWSAAHKCRWKIAAFSKKIIAVFSEENMADVLPLNP